MASPFTNTHLHVFNSACAPDRFLLILPMRFVRRIPKATKKLIDSKVGRFLIRLLYNIGSRKDSNSRKEFDKYISFLDVGTSNSQTAVFKMALTVGQQYDSAVRIVGLTLNMDHMDNVSKPKKGIDTQLEEVKEIKRHYPSNFFPFLGVDPRHKSGADLLNWSKQYFETGVSNAATGVACPFFCGIKLYPALGFFPFDPKLDDLYRYAEQQQIPVMTHCTRVGSQYIGEEIENLIPPKPAMILPATNPNASLAAQQSIERRIALFSVNGWIKNSKRGENDRACDLFGHPENYITLLETYPNLKLCLAHMGGTDEILDPPTGTDLDRGERELAEIRAVDRPSWFERIREMMITYPNLYTDISYTLSDFKDVNTEVFRRVTNFFNTLDNQGRPLSERVLFGTDFFMTEREKRESELYADARVSLAPWWDTFSRVNPKKFIG